MRARRSSAALLLASLGLLAHGAVAELRVAPPIGDGMVVQRQVPVPIHGWADANAKVVVTFGGRIHTARADSAGRWKVELPPREAGGPYEMRITSATAEVLVRDLLVGDLWICSGQSNMEWVVADSLDAAREIATTDEPAIRHLKVPRSWALMPETTLAGGVWEPADPEHVGGFTAVGFFFARALRPHVQVPIGLVNTTWGGSRIEAWMSAAALGLEEKAGQVLLAQERAWEEEVRQRLEARVGELPDRDRGLADGRPLWAEPDLDESAWHGISVPALWEQVDWEGLDGIAWYRTAFELTAAEAAMGARLGLGKIDDSDISWVNGHRVGTTEMAWNRPRVYDVRPELLVEGRNVIAVRVEDTGGGGGIYGDPESLFVEVDGRRQPLAGSWRFQLGAVTLNLEDRKREMPTVLYNKMVHPLLPTPVKGVLWYQGESNSGRDDAFEYRRLFATMIEDWRQRWGNEELPFLYAQLANYGQPPAEPGESDWAVLRESQSAALALAATAQVVLIDAGEADDIHPRDKQVVGERLALAARQVAYGEEIVYSGPVYRGIEVDNGSIVLDFDHVGSGLVAGGGSTGALRGFAIAGADRRFVWAEAEIEDNRVAVRSGRVPQPVAVRYGWADNPEGANLYNREGLPASPFRTDAWEAESAELP